VNKVRLLNPMLLSIFMMGVLLPLSVQAVPATITVTNLGCTSSSFFHEKYIIISLEAKGRRCAPYGSDIHRIHYNKSHTFKGHHVRSGCNYRLVYDRGTTRVERISVDLRKHSHSRWATIVFYSGCSHVKKYEK